VGFFRGRITAPWAVSRRPLRRSHASWTGPRQDTVTHPRKPVRTGLAARGAASFFEAQIHLPAVAIMGHAPTVRASAVAVAPRATHGSPPPACLLSSSAGERTHGSRAPVTSLALTTHHSPLTTRRSPVIRLREARRVDARKPKPHWLSGPSPLHIAPRPLTRACTPSHLSPAERTRQAWSNPGRAAPNRRLKDVV